MKLTNTELRNQLNEPRGLNEDAVLRYEAAHRKADDRATKADECSKGTDVHKELARGEVPPMIVPLETSDSKEYWDGFRMGCQERVDNSTDFLVRVDKEIFDQSPGQPIRHWNQGYIDGYLLYDRHARKDTSNEFGPPNDGNPNCASEIYQRIRWTDLRH